MIQLAIRDDDMNFFTKVEDIQKVYKDFGEFPVSFAVIPAVKDISTKGACPETRGNTIPWSFEKNEELVHWLRNRISAGKADALLHGINHDYKFISGKRCAEMQWRDMQNDLIQEIAYHKNMLENVLDYEITCFVAPSNKITKSCLDAVVANGLNYSGIIPIEFERAFTLRNVGNYLFRWFARFFTKKPWPGVLKYSTHLEINACLLQSGDYLRKMYDFCSRWDLPMVVNVHYWHLRDNPSELETLRSFVMDYAIPKGAIPTTLSNILKTSGKCRLQ